VEAALVPDPRRWRALALVCVAFFMVVLDVAIVNVALPSIAVDLRLSQDTLQWIVTAYSLAFGGFLLLGGRAADLFGRRRVFMTGMALFTAGSFACGLAESGTMLIIFRAIQGLGGAIVSPATLAIISASFRHGGAERNKAFGIWGAVAGSGAAAGVLLGGILTEYFGWSWIFFVNVPVGLAIFALAPMLISEGRIEGGDRRVDPLAAVLVTAGLVTFVYAMSEAPDAGWLSGQTILLTLAAVALVGIFVFRELRTDAPLVPLSLFRIRPVFVANAVGALLGAALFGGFFLLTLYMQQVLGYSALKAGLAFLATAGMTIPAAAIAQAVVTRTGVKYVMVVGLVLLAFAYLWYTRLPTDGTFLAHLLVPYVASGFGLAFVFIPLSLAALTVVEDRISGISSGLLNTSQQIGGALGVAIISTISTTHTESLLADGVSPPEALTEGFRWAFWAPVLFAVTGAVIAAVILRTRDVPTHAIAEAPGPAA
jgi:EmrB/QacA subfamily drug resistance transporter